MVLDCCFLSVSKNTRQGMTEISIVSFLKD